MPATVNYIVFWLIPVRKAAQSMEVALVVIISVTRRNIMVGGVLQKPLD